MRIRFTKNQTIEAMKKLTMIAVMLLISFTGFAQRGQGPAQNPEERAKKMTERLAETLELSAEQKEAIYAINLENASKRQAQVEVRQQEREEQRARMSEVQSQQVAAIEKILSPEQKEKWAQMRAQNQGEGPRMQNRKGGSEDSPRMGKRRGESKAGVGKPRKNTEHRKDGKPIPIPELNPIMN
jgi:periplasmic protein CpxP/Spy